MGRLGDVLEAIHDAPRLTGALHARAYQVRVISRLRDVHDWWQRLTASGSTSGMLITATVGTDDRSETDHELWWAGDTRWRADAAGTVQLRLGDVQRTWSPAGGVEQPADGATAGWEPVLRPFPLLAWFDATVGDAVEVAARECWSVSLQPTPRLRPRGAPLGMMGMPRWIGTSAECAIDVETGIALSYVARHDDEVVDAWTTTLFELLPSIDVEVFAFTPPDGSPFRDPQAHVLEAMLLHAREQGIDLTGVDTNDYDAVSDAVRGHRGWRPPDPRRDAEQYVPTGPPPDDRDAAEREVRAVFEQLVTASDDASAVPAVQGGANLGPALAEAGRRAPGGTHPATVGVELVKFLAPDEAAVWFTLERDGRHLFGPVVGRARRIGDRWLVTRETFAQLVGSVGVQCPPPP